MTGTAPIFISYPKENKEVAEILCDFLEQNGLRCWIAPRDIPPAQSYSKAIIQAIKDSRLLILVFSSHANQSDHVLREVERAANRKIPILPFRIEDTALSEDLEYFLSTPQWLDAYEPPLESHFALLLEAVRRLYGTSPDSIRTIAHISDQTSQKKRHSRWSRHNVGVTAGIIGLLVLLTAAGIGLYLRFKAPDPAKVNAAISEILTNTINLDARLGYVKQALSPDYFEQKLQKVRKQVAPALTDQMNPGYRALLAETQVASLRQAINSSPLRLELSDTSQIAIMKLGADPEHIRAYRQSLADVQWATESLFNRLAARAKSTDPDAKAWQTLNHQRTLNAIQRLDNYSRFAHLCGLRLLRSLTGMTPNHIDETLQKLAFLEPRKMLSGQVLNKQLSETTKQLALLLQERNRLLEATRKSRDKMFEELEAINRELEIQSTDSPGMVIGKAISLRQLGRPDEAMTVFARYGELFAERDSVAQQYARIAQQFTLQLNKLDIQGGIFLHEITPGSAADQAGLAVGDIIVEYGGRSLIYPSDFSKALTELPQGEPTRLEFLRMDSQSRFSRHSTQVICCPLGVGYRSI